jgi:hypothetical protein
MGTRDENVNVNASSEVKSIQITINLGQATENVVLPESQAPMGTFIRQVLLAADNSKQIRTSFVPDNLANDTSIQITPSDPGELAKWKQLLGDPENIDIDTGDIVMRLEEEGGTITWLPEGIGQDPIVRRFQPRTEGEPGGATITDFMQCFAAEGRTAAAATRCWPRL